MRLPSAGVLVDSGFRCALREQPARSDWRGAALARAQGPHTFFSTRERPNIGLNRRLPETTQRDVLSNRSIVQSMHAQETSDGLGHSREPPA